MDLRRLSLPILCSLLTTSLLIGGCSEQKAAQSDSDKSAANARSPVAEVPLPAQPEPKAPQIAMAEEPSLVEMAKALEQFDAKRAARLALLLDGMGELDGSLMRARWLSFRGDDIQSSRELEAARKQFPQQGRVYATAAELHAAAGRLSSAREELNAGFDNAGSTIELWRAQGVIFLCTDAGGAVINLERGFECLRRAREINPNLPFIARPWSQACLLLGRRALTTAEPERALEWGEMGLAEMPDDLDIQELCADANAALARFPQAIAIYERSLREGKDCAGSLASLHHKEATALLLEGKKDEACDHYWRARQYGLSDSELGFGLQALESGAQRALEEAYASYESSEYDQASAHFTRALRYDPTSLEAKNQAAKCAFRVGDYEQAAQHFSELLDHFNTTEDPLPEPIHLNLARCYVLSGRAEEAEYPLKHQLARNPNAEWATETREMLERLSEM